MNTLISVLRISTGVAIAGIGVGCVVTNSWPHQLFLKGLEKFRRWRGSRA